MPTLAPQPAPAPAPYRTPLAVRRMLFLVAGLLGLALVAMGASNLLDLAARKTTEDVRSYTDVRVLRIDGASDVHLTSAPAGAELQVRARVVEGLRSPRRDVRRHAGGVLELSSSCTFVFGSSCSVDYDIAVPAGTAVRVDAGGGDVSAADLTSTAPLELAASGGDVTAVDLSAPELRLASSAGDVEARGLDAPRVTAESSAGDVALSLRTPADRLRAESSAGDVSLVVPDEAYDIEVSSSAGDVDDRGVRTDPSSRRTIRAHSSAGDVRIVARR